MSLSSSHNSSLCSSHESKKNANRFATGFLSLKDGIFLMLIGIERSKMLGIGIMRAKANSILLVLVVYIHQVFILRGAWVFLGGLLWHSAIMRGPKVSERDIYTLLF